jgi:Pentapeptide repeats (8 copies)
LLYLVFHFYVITMLALLVRTAAPFEQQLWKTLPIEADRELYRARVENALFLQLQVGPKPEKAGFNGYLLASIAFFTIGLAPLATLILMQMQFLPYHSLRITWRHRIMVFADLFLLTVIIILNFRMRRRYLRSSQISKPLFGFAGRDRSRNLVALIAALGVIVAVPWLSLWEGRWAGENYIGRIDLAAALTRDMAGLGNGVVLGLFKDRLILSNEIIVGEKPLAEVKKEMASRGGDFVPTILFDDRDLQSADLRGADLRGVALDRAHMQGVDLEDARLDGARLTEAELQGANLAGAQLPGATSPKRICRAQSFGMRAYRARISFRPICRAHRWLGRSCRALT